jgi:hypothetical protein
MMAADPAVRFLRAWEAADPIPPPDFATEADDPRAAAARRQADEICRLAPELAALHIIDPDGPEETHDVDGMQCMHYLGFYHVPSYADWFVDCEMSETFSYQARVLALLQSNRPPNRWILKNPGHLAHLDAFAAQYPTAKFVMTHRDPVAAIPSVCSLQYRWNYSSMTDGLDLSEHGHAQLRFWSESMLRGLHARSRLGEDRFIDVWHSDLVRDPNREVARIYEFLGRELTDDARARILEYTVVHRSGVHGDHRYSLDTFGLTAEEISGRFRDYLERFGR